MAYRRTAAVERRLDATRERILDAARTGVMADGWSGVTIAGVAREAGVATGSIYLHFSSRSEVMVELYRRLAEHELAVITAIATGETTAPDRLEAAVRTFAERAFRGRRQAYAVITEPVDEAVAVVRLDFHRRFVGQFAAIVADGVASGEFVDQFPQVTGPSVVGALVESLMGPLTPDTPPLEDRAEVVVDDLVRLARRMAGADPSAPADVSHHPTGATA